MDFILRIESRELNKKDTTTNLDILPLQRYDYI